MRKTVKIEFETHDNTISIRDIQMVENPYMVEINIGGWQDEVGGCDGESVFMTYGELEEFINECSGLLAFLRKRDNNG